MNASTLVDLLLEMNVVNVKDIDVQINRLAARISDPRAQKWFRRVPRFWLINIDKLQEPYEAPAEPRDERRGSKYYHEPFDRRAEKSGPLWPSWHGEQPVNKPNVCPRCKGEGMTVDKEGSYHRCKTCGGTGLGEKPYAGGDSCPACRGSGQTKPGPEGAQIPAKQGEEGAGACLKCGGTGLFPVCRTCNGEGAVNAEICKDCGGSGKAKIKRPAGGEGFFMGEQWVRRLLGEADPGYDPEKRTYTTNLHVNPKIIDCPKCEGEGTVGNLPCTACGGGGRVMQRIAKDIEQSFTPFNPVKAKVKGIHGGPPTKKNLEPWMLDPATKEKKLYHFDPIQVKRRDLFDRLAGLIHFLNFSASVLTRQNTLTPEESEGLSEEEISYITGIRQKQTNDAQALFEQLRTMKTDDVAGFRSIILKAEEFVYNVRNHPEMFKLTKSGKVIARNGDLVLRRCDDVETALVCGQKPAFNGIEPKDWCLKNDYNIRNYITQGPLFYVERDGMAYIGIHPASRQVKNTKNEQVEQAFTSKEVERIAPLLVPFDEISEESLRSEARHLSDLVGAARHERRISGNKSLQQLTQ